MLIERMINLFKKAKSISLVRDSFWALATRGASAGLVLALSILLAHWAGDEAFGAYTYVWSWVTTIGLFLGLGIPALQLRFFTTYLSASDYKNLKGLILWSSKVVVGGSIVVSIIGIWFVQTEGLFSTFDENRNLWVFAIIFLPLVPVLKLLEEMVRSSRRILASQAPILVVRPSLMLFCSAIIVYGIIVPLTAELIMLIMLGSSAIITLIYSVILFKTIPNMLYGIKATTHISEWKTVAFPLLLNLSFGILLNRLDVLMVGAMIGTSAAGFYFAGIKVASLSGKLLDAFLSGFTPRIAPLWREGKIDQLQNLITKSLPLIFWPSVIISGALVWFATDILSFWGESFVSMSTGLRILVLAFLFDASTGPINRLLDMTDHQNISAQMYGTSAVLNAIFNLIGIYYWGITGAAIATGTVILLRNIWAVWWVYTRLGIKSCIIFSPFGHSS